MLTIKKIQKEDILEEVNLFSNFFPENKKFNYEYLNWLYYKNPAGKVLLVTALGNLGSMSGAWVAASIIGILGAL